eukprot:384573_1
MSDQNIRVCCRFRPPNKIELKSKGHKLVAKCSSDCKSVTIGTSSRKMKTFNFDYIFPSGSNQETVFNYSGLPLIDEVMRGYNCTLFAYGQTGSGKTYSMEGIIDPSGADRINEGLIPRMVRTLFDRILDDNSANFEYTLRVSFVEIYNEKLRDLLQPNGPDLKIREKQTGAKGVYIENVFAPFVASPEEVFDHLTNGHVNRSVASTRMNEHSSRSHAIFMLQLDARNTETGSSKASKLMLVDLAGSEKVKKTQATGQTLKEAKQINKSLMVLGLVINSLVEKKKHVPYRDSKLTRLLSDALGGNSKTCLLVTASPSKYNCDESISTMRFGTRAKSIKNEATINQELSVAEYKKLLEKAKKREEIYKNQIKSLQVQNDALITECKNNNIDISKIATKTSHKPANTTAMVTMVPSTQNMAANNAQIEALQHKLDDINDEKVKLTDQMRKKDRELRDSTHELDECHTHIAEMMEQSTLLQKRYEELHAAKAHLEKLFQSLNSGNDASHDRFNAEKTQWDEDKLSLMEEIRTKENKLIELKAMNEEQEVMMKQLRDENRNAEKKAKQKQNNNKEEAAVAAAIMPSSPADKSDDNKAKMIALLDTARRYRSQNEKNTEQIKKLNEKLKAYKRRDEVNKQLRDNWNKQLNQMEQAVILANEIYNRERMRHEAEMAEKEVEILKLRKFLLSFTNRHAKSQRMVNGSSTNAAAHKSNNNRLQLSAPGANPNAPGARKSKIVKPKVIKAGGHAIKPRTFGNQTIQRRAIGSER